MDHYDCHVKTWENPANLSGNLKYIIPISVFLCISILAIYWQVLGFEFTLYDDPLYVTDNSEVRKGITLGSIWWAFTSVHAANWHPLTWISHMIDVQFFGLNPGMHHLTNVVIHILNTILLFVVLTQMTGAVWRSAIVSALFGIHPLHVESVAWISERKDVLSTFFWLATMASYYRYSKDRSIKRYLLVLMFYVLGILSKPMVVTLPFVLLLLDYWPLNRMGPLQEREADNTPDRSMIAATTLWKRAACCIKEKIPMIVLAALSCGITFFAQMKGQAVSTLDTIRLSTRIMNAIVVYLTYIEKTLLPLNLCAFYPYRFIYPLSIVVLCSLFILLVTVLVLLRGRKAPYLAVGWLWYLGTLVPVIGIVQVGSQSMADRYTYIPLIGIFISIIWAASDLLGKKRLGKVVLGSSSAIIIMLLAVTTYAQIQYWRNSRILFEHVLHVTGDTAFAHKGLGSALFEKGDRKNAEIEYRKVYKLKPGDPDVNNMMGCIMYIKGNFYEAISYFTVALSKKPHQPDTLTNLGSAFYGLGNIKEAIYYYHMALNERPNFRDAINSLAIAQNALNALEKQVSEKKEKIKQDPDNVKLYVELGELYRKHFEFDSAIEQYQKALSIQPDSAQLLNGLVPLYTAKGQGMKAIEILMKVKQLRPDNAYVYYDIACLYARENNKAESINWLRQSVEKGFHDWDLLGTDPNISNIRNSEYVRMLMAEHGIK